MIKNIIFDFGKVLVNYDIPAIVNTFFDDKEECQKFLKVICTPAFVDALDKEDIPFDQQIADAQAMYPQWKDALQQFSDRYLEFVTVEVPGMHDLLTRLRAEGYRLYGLTNWCSIVHKVIQKFDILQMVDDRIISSEEHLLKPDVAIYNRLCEKFNVKAEECVFTDDKAVNVEGARKAGMKGIVFHDAVQFEKELREML